jgi:hypothetical protein
VPKHVEFVNIIVIVLFQWFLYDHYHHLLENCILLQWLYHNLQTKMQFDLSCIQQNLYLLVHVGGKLPHEPRA